MNHRLHACLDGELPREALSTEERARLAALEAVLEEAAAPLRAMPAPDLTERVMRALPPAADPPPRAAAASAWNWLWSPRMLTLRFRPVYGVAGLALAVLAGVLLPRPSPGPAPAGQAVAERPAAARLYVQFRLEAPGASQVELAGSFTGWSPGVELRESAPGVWTALVPLEPGVHDYTFVVDGERWVVDPYAPQVPDSFGGRNSRLFLPSPVDQA
jgi:hypothetical protein